MRPYAVLFLLVCASTVSPAQEIQPYMAKVFTHRGIKKGILYKVNDQYISIEGNKEYMDIPLRDVKKIKLKALKNSMSLKIADGMSKGVRAGKKSFNNEWANYQSGYSTREPTLADASGSILVHALAGGMLGAVKGLGKSKTIRLTETEIQGTLEELKKYAVYTQYLRN